jgi:hypothetical protein
MWKSEEVKSKHNYFGVVKKQPKLLFKVLSNVPLS